MNVTTLILLGVLIFYCLILPDWFFKNFHDRVIQIIYFLSDFVENGDDFQTPMSTPPSEAEDAGKGATTTTAADLSSLSLSEAQLYDRLYER